RSSLESRLVSLLRPDVRRGPASIRTVVTTGLLLAAALFPLATVRVIAAPASAPPLARAEGVAVDGARAVTRAEGSEVEENEIRQTKTKDKQVRETKLTETKVRQQARQETRTDVHEAVEAVAADHAGTSDPQTRSGEAWYERGRELYDDERYGEAS